MHLHPILQALGWALLHFLWEGAALALLLFLAQGLARGARAPLRYAMSCAVMLLMLLSFVATVFEELPNAPQPVIENHLTEALPLRPVKPPAPAVETPTLPVRAPDSAPPDWLAGLWLLGVASMSIYTLLGVLRVERLKRRTIEHIEATDCLEELMRKLGIRRTVRVCTSALAEAPAVVGWLRPYILLPVTALTGLTESQIRAILAHELAHIRRHDYLVNLLQTSVETLLPYHPAVWWVSRQIRQERENCCDDVAVAVCGDAVEYAGALAEMEGIRARVPEPALAASGGELLSRIRRVLGEPEQSSRSLGRIAAAGLALAIAGVPTLLSQEAKPTFEVASVKPNSAGGPGQYFRMGGATVSMTNQTLKNMIQWAYRIRDFQLIGGPGWIGADHFDVEAKTKADASLEQRQLMVQALLQDRFKLSIHREVRQLPIYNMTVVKGGLKIQPIKDGSCIPVDPKSPANPPAPGKTYMDYCGTGGIGRGMIEDSSGTMAEFAEQVSNAVKRTVVDKTGVSGRFRIYLTFAPEGTATSENGGPPPPSDAPSIFTALQEQLGVKLDSAKGPVEVLVIDHAEKPVED